jgi:polar amino acid transport system substrate-binding protein
MPRAFSFFPAKPAAAAWTAARKGSLLSFAAWRSLVGLAPLFLACLMTFESQAQTLRVMLNDVAPYTLHGDPQQRPGMHHEIMQALARQTDLALELNSALYVRLALSLKDGSADLVVGVEGPELETLATRVRPMHVFKFVVITKKSSEIRNVAQLKGKLLGVARGAFYDESINNDDSIRKYGMADPFQGVRMLALDRLDAVISSDYLLAYALRQPGLDSSQFDKPFAVNEKSYVIYARKDLNAEVLVRLQRGMDALQKSGQVDRILRSYQ